MTHRNPTRWQREMIVQGWKLAAGNSALVFATHEDGTWIVERDSAHAAPESSGQKVIALRCKDGRELERREGVARTVCKRINPAFRLRSVGVNAFARA